MPTSITSSGITFDDATTQATSATKAGGIGTTQLANGAVTAAKLDSVGQGAGNPPIYGCRAWVNFDGTKDTTGAASTANTNRLIRANGNVGSVLRNSVGNYTITFTTAMPDEHYCAAAGINSFVSTNAVGVKTSGTSASSCVLQTISNGSHTDMANASLVVFR